MPEDAAEAARHGQDQREGISATTGRCGISLVTDKSVENATRPRYPEKVTSWGCAMLPVHTILFPTDFSDSAQQVFPLACSLARDCGARIVVLHVAAPLRSQDPLSALQDRDEYHKERWQTLHQMRAPDANVHVEHQLETGDAAPEILRVAQQNKAGLIVIGTHGGTGIGRLLVGSVTEQVLRAASCPVLAVKKNQVASNIQTILLPTDLSESSESALGVAFSLARDYHARLIVLHVASSGNAVPYSQFEMMLKESSSYRHELEEQLRQCQKPACNAEFRVAEGDAADQINRIAQETRCDLIVMGTHGRTGLQRLLMGSVAENTLRNASCPVLLVKQAKTSNAV